VCVKSCIYINFFEIRNSKTLWGQSEIEVGFGVHDDSTSSRGVD
jgi:hypothetical protein